MRFGRLTDAVRVQCMVIPAIGAVVTVLMVLSLMVIDGHGTGAIPMAGACGAFVGFVLLLVGGLVAMVAGSGWWSRAPGAAWARERAGTVLCAVALSPLPFLAVAHTDLLDGIQAEVVAGAALIAVMGAGLVLALRLARGRRPSNQA